MFFFIFDAYAKLLTYLSNMCSSRNACYNLKGLYNLTFIATYEDSKNPKNTDSNWIDCIAKVPASKYNISDDFYFSFSDFPLIFVISIRVHPINCPVYNNNKHISITFDLKAFNKTYKHLGSFVVFVVSSWIEAFWCYVNQMFHGWVHSK